MLRRLILLTNTSPANLAPKNNSLWNYPTNKYPSKTTHKPLHWLGKIRRGLIQPRIHFAGLAPLNYLAQTTSLACELHILIIIRKPLHCMACQIHKPLHWLVKNTPHTTIQARSYITDMTRVKMLSSVSTYRLENHSVLRIWCTSIHQTQATSLACHKQVRLTPTHNFNQPLCWLVRINCRAFQTTSRSNIKTKHKKFEA